MRSARVAQQHPKKTANAVAKPQLQAYQIDRDSPFYANAGRPMSKQKEVLVIHPSVVTAVTDNGSNGRSLLATGHASAALTNTALVGHKEQGWSALSNSSSQKDDASASDIICVSASSVSRSKGQKVAGGNRSSGVQNLKFTGLSSKSQQLGGDHLPNVINGPPSHDNGPGGNDNNNNTDKGNSKSKRKSPAEKVEGVKCCLYFWRDSDRVNHLCDKRFSDITGLW
jgi:hypothetical protein